MDTVKLQGALAAGLQELGLSITQERQDKLIRYLELLVRWNKAYNLTAVTDPMEMVHLHLLDSLAILPYLKGERFIDVGTGPGLPGIPLAITKPEANFVLLDSNGKRTRFLFQVRTTLGLSNCQEIHARAEAYNGSQPFDGVISRAFTSLTDMVDKTHHLLAGDGCFYAMKGRLPEKELSELAKAYTVSACHKLNVPGVDGERHLIEIGLSPAGTVS
jgi:16S rRNA (guanine527-N7)-methyltransferase